MNASISLKPAGAPAAKWLLLARAAWLAVALPALIIVLYGITANAIGWWTLDMAHCPAGPDFERCLAHAQAARQLGITGRFYAVEFTLGLVVQNLSWFLVAGLVFWRRSSSWFALVFSLEIILIGSFHLDGVFENIWLNRYPAFEPWIHFLMMLGSALMVVWYRFPDGKYSARWQPPLAIIWLAIRLVDYLFPGSPANIYTWPMPIPLLCDSLFIISLLAALILRYRSKAGPLERQQIKWVTVFGTIFGLIFILESIIGELGFIQPGLPDVISNLTELPIRYLASGLFAGSLGVAILRHRLWDIDVIIRRTLTYGLLTTILALAYFSLVIALQAAFAAVTGQRETAFVTVLTTLAIAALFAPLRLRLKTAIDRAFYRQKYNAGQALERFSLRTASEVDLASLSARLIGVVDETVQPEHASLWLRRQAEEK